MKWSKQRPTKPGWYWWREGGRQEIARVLLDKDGGVEQLYFLWTNGAMIRKDPLGCVSSDCEFAGPIEEPA